MKKLSEEITNTLDSNKTFTHLSTIVKELVENSIDAKATKINIKILKSGIELIEIRDDGTGMSKNTLEKLCQRFSSTKINNYNDLNKLETFGFRGEALSILSYISTLTIITRDKNSQIGYQAVFINGKMDTKTNIKSLVCNIGTVIQVQNIFYNNQIRLNYYTKNKNDELEEIINTVAKIAFHFINISFSLYTDKNNNIFITNAINSNNENDLLEHRKKLASKLFNQDLSDGFFKFDNNQININSDNNNLNMNSGIAFTLKTMQNAMKDFKFECYHTKPSNYIKKSKLITFINNRLVKINSLKKIFNDVYSKFLIKKGNYFAYISINCPPEFIDVNVKANKSEVFFQNEDQLLENFGNLLENVLKEEINSKNYYANEYKGFESDNKKESNLLFDENKDKKIIYAKDKIRVDNNNISIERYLSLKKIDSKRRPKSNEEQKDEEEDLIDKKINKNNELVFGNLILKEIFQNLFLQDENNMIDEDENKINSALDNIFKKGVYIGYIKDLLNFNLQYQTSMYLINTRVLLQEYFFYQLLLSYNNSNSFIENIKINSENTFNLENLLKFIANQFDECTIQQNHAIEMLKNLEKIEKFIIPNVKLYMSSIIDFSEEKNEIKEMKIVNFFKNDNFIIFCLDYIPLIYFSLVEYLYFKQDEFTLLQENKNMNCVIEMIKIVCYYYATACVDYLKHQNEEFANTFFRDIILYDIKIDNNFKLRKKLKSQEVCEKIIDTETLYTVFERC